MRKREDGGGVSKRKKVKTASSDNVTIYVKRKKHFYSVLIDRFVGSVILHR